MWVVPSSQGVLSAKESLSSLCCTNLPAASGGLAT
jgi:hypothetical protein